jgi:hypothetical protein
LRGELLLDGGLGLYRVATSDASVLRQIFVVAQPVAACSAPLPE